MRCLLDTHTLLWFIDVPSRLSPTVLEIMQNPDNELYVSTISYWEIAIKRSAGKLAFDKSALALEQYLEAMQMPLLPILTPHIERVETLPFHHRDPFDRMLIAQAACEDLTLLSCDAHFAAYPVRILW